MLFCSLGGFYSQIVKPNLRLISLNTILYYSPNHATENMTDPAGQFEWLEGTLDTSQQTNEKVYIIAHVPVGYLPFARNTTAVREHFNERLVSIFRKYSNVIAGHFYGHTHRDSIMVLLDEQGNAVNSLFVAPAVTPIMGVLESQSNNPGFRLYQYDSSDYNLLVEFSLAGSNRRRDETRIMGYWADSLMGCEEQNERVSLEEILIFATGLRTLPSAGMQPQPSIDLIYNSTFPLSNTCGNVIRLPKKIQKQHGFWNTKFSRVWSTLDNYCGGLVRATNSIPIIPLL
ncbi:ASM3A phosphodiesterase, partial [Polyodon spathula]|nr:ASM3A phosphodiesterase [Polyodon spathula]